MVYLIHHIATHKESIPLVSFVMIAVIYGSQVLIFIMQHKLDMVGWMVLYIIALPLFSCLLPLYSFWHMDDFSWGATRRVMEGSGKKRHIAHISATRLQYPN